MAPPDDTFRPPGESWTPVSPQLLKVRRVILVAQAVVLGAVAGALSRSEAIPGWIPAALVVVTFVGFVWAWVALGRRVRAWGYAERDEDLLVTSGVLLRRLVVVPYGRMQLVDVTAGPLDRMFGIATVQLHTAAATTDARIPGLAPADAAALRDRLAALGEQRSAGL